MELTAGRALPASLMGGDRGSVMKQTRKVRGQRLGFWGLLVILTVPGSALGAEFSASMLVKDDAKIMPGKIQVSNG